MAETTATSNETTTHNIDHRDRNNDDTTNPNRPSSNKSIFVSPDQTRLITIVAHVDHGKTTLADNLIEYNGIISERLAGTIRYLDSDPEEQRRGITMRTSAIALKHKYYDKDIKNGTEMIIHVLDSPGHTDFCMEVSSAVTACDGALIVIDAVEGMGPRSHQVLRETYANKLIPILVINKIDRLCTELCLSPVEAYIRLRNLIESVNAAASAMITSARTFDTTTSTITTNNFINTTTEKQERNFSLNKDEDEEKKNQEEEKEERIWTFDPVNGSNNVVFCSALYGWGFTIQSLARSLFRSKIVPIKPAQLKKFLFGDYKLVDNNTKIVKWKHQQQQSTDDENNNNIPIFAKYGLQPIWSIYEGVAMAAISIGIASTLFADGRGGAVSNTSSFARSHGGGGGGSGSSSSMNNNNYNDHRNKKGNKKQQNEAKVRADTPGMDQVLEFIQIGAAITQTSGDEGNQGKKRPHQSTISTVEELQTILTRTGANTEETILRCLLRRFRPLADCVLDTICDYCPSPTNAASNIRSQILKLQNYPNNNNNNNTDDYDSQMKDYERIQMDVSHCSIEKDAATVAHICKFLSTDLIHIRDSGLAAARSAAGANIDGGNDQNGNDSRSTSVILGIARVLSGRLRTGSEYYLIGPKYNPLQHHDPLPRRKIRLYLLMGSSFVKVDEVPSGHLCGIYYDLKDVEMYKTVTLCDSPNAMPLSTIDNRVRPLVKVSIEPENASDLYLVERGLAKLSLADAAVEVTSTAKGERILACLGELHLEQSILDLEKTYCGKEIKLRISDPIVDFAETTTWFDNEQDYSTFPLFDDNLPPLRQTTIPPYNEEEGIANAKNGRCRAVLSGRCAAIWIRVVPLVESVHRMLMKYCKNTSNEDDATASIDDDETESELIKIGKALNCAGINENNNKEAAVIVLKSLKDALCSIDGNGNALIENSGLREGLCVRGVESDEIYVPQKQDKISFINKLHTNIKETTASADTGEEQRVETDTALIKAKSQYQTLLSRIKENTGLDKSTASHNNRNEAVDDAAWDIWKSDMKGSIVAGFQLAVRAGPVCEEPVHNVLVVLEGAEVALTRCHNSNSYLPSKHLSGGMVVASIRSGIRCALLSRPARLMEGHLRLTLHSSLAGLGALYPVLSKRRGKVLDDSMVDGTDLLMITASIPQAEAFGLAPELFGKTSGEVTAPEMLFSHWKCLDVDPFWIPTSEEEREDFGELQNAGDSSTGLDNTALSYIRKVRLRKGLMVDSSRTVLSAEKQRTLKR